MSQVILQNKIQKDNSDFKALVDGTLTEVTADMLDGSTSIRSNLFYRLANLMSVEIPVSVLSIEELAFADCYALQNITMQNGLTTIGAQAFLRAGTNVSPSPSNFDVIIPNSVTSMGHSAFYYSKITSVTLSNKMTSIPNQAFRSCSNLKSITIPEGIESIGYNAVSSCISLTNVNIPDSVTSIGDEAFYGCINLLSFTVLSLSPPTLGSSAFYDPLSKLAIYVPAESVDTYKAASGWSNYASKIQAIPT